MSNIKESCCNSYWKLFDFVAQYFLVTPKDLLLLLATIRWEEQVLKGGENDGGGF